MVDCLLLRYLYSVNKTPRKGVTVTHLITNDGLPEPLDESCHHFGVSSLVCESSYGALCQQLLGYFVDLFERATTTFRSGYGCRQAVYAPGQTFAPVRLVGVFANGRSGDVLLEPIQLRYKLFNPVPDVFKLLRAFASVVHGSHRLNQYLVMFYKCIHPSEGGLEGGKPICRLFCDIE
jgi:hypothetical protein